MCSSIANANGSHECFDRSVHISQQLAPAEAQLSCRSLDHETVFAFASPANQAATGPVERFASMLRTPAYEPLLRHRSADIVATMQVNLSVLYATK